MVVCSVPGVVSNLSFLVERSINVPGDNRFVKGIEDDVVLFGIVFVHEAPVSRRTGVLTVLFSFVVLLSMGMIMCID